MPRTAKDARPIGKDDYFIDTNNLTAQIVHEQKNASRSELHCIAVHVKCKLRSLLSGFVKGRLKGRAYSAANECWGNATRDLVMCNKTDTLWRLSFLCRRMFFFPCKIEIFWFVFSIFSNFLLRNWDSHHSKMQTRAYKIGIDQGPQNTTLVFFRVIYNKYLFVSAF